MELRLDITDSGEKGPIPALVESLGKIVEKLGVLGSVSRLSAAASAAKRSLMSFDKLNRLTAQSSKGSSKNSVGDFIAALKDENALKNLDGPLAGIAKIFRSLGVELDYSNAHLFVFAKRLSELPLKTQQMVQTTADFCRQLMGLPTAAEQAEKAMNRVDKSTMFTAGLMEMLPVTATQAAKGLVSSFADTSFLFQNQVSKPLKAVFDKLFSDVVPSARQAMEGTKEVVGGGMSAISDTVRNSWEQVLKVFHKTDDTTGNVVTGVVSSMKTVMNRLISGINSAIVEPFSGINSAFSKLKNFTVNGVQPFKNLNFSVSMPKIPLLASGAVLPANKPFLAMVGDQKHGTNIEAPLATIEQAVAHVMAENLEAEMAGHNATVAVLRQILEAVLGIGLDEDTLGRAAAAYSNRQAVMTGGF